MASLDFSTLQSRAVLPCIDYELQQAHFGPHAAMPCSVSLMHYAIQTYFKGNLSLLKQIVGLCTVMSKAGTVWQYKFSAEFKLSELAILLQVLEPSRMALWCRQLRFLKR